MNLGGLATVLTMQTGFTASSIWFTSSVPGVWTERAKCRRFPGFADQFTDSQTFEEADAALTICSDCPVRAACFAYGHSIRADGVWGGRLLQRGKPKRRLAAVKTPADD